VYGGALFMSGDATAIVKRSLFVAHFAGFGAAIYMSSGHLILEQLNITDCEVDYGDHDATGGALHLSSGANANLTQVHIKGCSADQGGAIFASESTVAAVDVFMADNTLRRTCTMPRRR